MEAATRSDRLAVADRYVAEADRSFITCRQTLISYLIKLNDALDARLPDLSQALLNRFCDALVDYLSAGHFRIFQRVSLPAGRYALLESTTEAGVAFHDRFGAVRRVRIDEVRQALELLARALSERFELEDELLAAL